MTAIILLVVFDVATGGAALIMWRGYRKRRADGTMPPKAAEEN